MTCFLLVLSSLRQRIPLPEKSLLRTSPIMSRALENQVAIVTGAAKGIGRGIAIKLASLGATVGIVYNSSSSQADQTVKDIHALGSSAKAFQGDLSSVAGIRTVFSQIKDAFPQGLDVVVLNAGVGAKLNLDEADEKSYDKVFDTNTKGAFFSAQESAKQLKDGGKLLFISTAATHAILPGGTIYTASKAAVDQFARLLAVELGARKISVNSIAPAYTETDMFPPELREFALATTPFKRVGRVEDIAEAVYGIIVSPWITGAVIPVTGGAVIY